jgi:phosphonate degradation associated HDIG domain protein
MALTIADICELFESKGGRAYSGEPVSQLEHALQTAWFAEQAGASPEMIAACLLHDLGHLLNDLGDTPTARGIDDTHQYYAIPFLRGTFGPAVIEPIRLHVDAKRYLCRVRPGYADALSADSKRSLVLQGGVFSAGEAGAFIAQPHAAAAAQLREWDDLAKAAGLATPPLAHFAAHLHACAPCGPTA